MTTIEQLRQQVDDEPYNISHHDDLINYLRLNKNQQYEALYRARLHKSRYFILNQTQINAILEDLLSIDDEAIRKEKLDHFYSYLVTEFPTVEYWLKYLEFCIDNKSADELQTIFIDALNNTVHDFANSHLIWDKLLQCFTNLYEETKDEDDLDRLQKLYNKRITFPHKTLTESFSHTSKFISDHFKENYDQNIQYAQQLFSATKKELDIYERHENNILKDPSNSTLWSDYINDISAYAKSTKQISTIFYRSLLYAKEDWISVWITYIYNLYTKTKNNDAIIDILPKFIKAFPNSCISYAEFIRNLPLFPQENDLFSSLRSRIDYLNLMKQNSYDDWKVLALSILSYEKYINSDKLYQDIDEFFTFAVDENNDIFHSVEKLCISIYEFKNNLPKAIELIDILLTIFRTQSDLWIFTIEFYRRHQFDYDKISNLYQGAVNVGTYLDWPERIIQEQLGFEQVYGTPHSYQMALVRADRTIKDIMQVAQWESRVIEDESAVSRKRSLDISPSFEPNKRFKDQSSAPSRNREELKVKVSNLPNNITEKKLINMFKDCGEIIDLTIYMNNDKYESVIEFDNEQSVFAALTKMYKTIGDSKIEVHRLRNCIIWVTNFPPTMDEIKLKELFSTCGNILNIRFPIQTTKKVRRFCYIEFSEPESVQMSLNLNGKSLTDELDEKVYNLIVKISDNKDKDRKSSIQRREVHVSNLDFKIDENDVKSFFEEKFGAIESITLPLKEEMKVKGYKNGGFGFIIFKSETSANEALQFNGGKFEDRSININPSKKLIKSNPREELKAFDDKLSIVIFGIDKTTTKDQIRLFIKEKINEPTKILQFPDHECVIVQFNSISDNGKASLILEAANFKNRSLAIGTKQDLLKKINIRPVSGKPKLLVPASIQRKR